MWAYRSPGWLPGGHLQTIYAAKIARAPQVNWRRERWSTPDQDFLDIDWAVPLTGQVNPQSPCLVLFHGLEGSSQSHYARAFAQVAMSLGWSMAVVHFRGCSGEPNKAPRAYHSGDDAEIDFVLNRFASIHSGDLVVVGVSLGGNALLKWAGVQGDKTHPHVRAVAAVCSPIDLTICGRALDRGVNQWLYTRMFLQTMKPAAIQKHAQYPGLFDLEKALAAKTLYDFDDAFTAPIHGFGGAADYWQQASSKPWLKHVSLPTLVLHAKNDPFVPVQAWATKEEVSQTVQLWGCDTGGHVGFPSGAFSVLAMPQAVCQWLAEQIKKE